jgi:CRP-like cAMP-binding protein
MFWKIEELFDFYYRYHSWKFTIVFFVSLLYSDLLERTMIDHAQFNLITYKKNSYILVEGKQDDCFYIIKEGKVQLSRNAEVVKERDGNILKPGDFFGVVATMSSHRHIETALAVTDVSVIVVQKSQFDAFIQSDTSMAMNIIMQFANRMRYLTKSLSHLTLNDETEEENASNLFLVGKYYDKVENYSHAYYAYHQYLKYCPDGTYIAEAKERLEAVSSYAKVMPFINEGNKRTYGPDTILYIQGEPGEELYVIQSGSVKITKIVNDNEILLSMLKPGDIVGELAILESKPRSITAITHDEECTLIVISKANFSSIVHSNPQIIGHLIQSFAERIWFLYRQLSNTVLVNPVARIYDALLIQLERIRIPLDSKEGYTFNFGMKELVALTGIPEEESNKAAHRITEDPNIKIVDDNIQILRIADMTKEAEYYRNIEWRKKVFRESR